MEYKLTRICENCKNEDVFEFTKIQTAFDLYDVDEIYNRPCSKCYSLIPECLNLPFVKLDKEILDMWGNNEELYLNPQDEEIILAEMHYFPLILNSINEGQYLKRKIEILLESICILLYDNTVSSNEFSEEENIERKKNVEIIRPELIRLKDKIKESEKHIMEYIKVVVFPQIELRK